MPTLKKNAVWSPEAWVLMIDSPEVEGLFEERHLAHGRALAREAPQTRGLGLEALAHPTAPSLLNASLRAPKDDAAVRARLKGLSGGLAAGAAFAEGRSFEGEGLIDADGHVHLGVLRRWLDFGPGAADQRVRLKATRSGIAVELADGSKAAAGVAALKSPGGAEGRGLRVVAAPMIAQGVEAAWCDPVLLWPIHVHGVARLDHAQMAEFTGSLGRALEDMRQVDAPMQAELLKHLKTIIPLDNPQGHGSVSSTYRELPGLECLSHSEDSLLQQETLIHEYCHTKINLLTERDPLLFDGQKNAVFYSPWRKDPRPLRGVLLGAHAFLNVGLHLLHSVQAKPEQIGDGSWVLKSIVRRTLQVESALRIVSAYGRLTPFGSQMTTEMFRYLSVLQHAVDAFPPEAVAEASKENEDHRARHALGRTFLHNMQLAAQS